MKQEQIEKAARIERENVHKELQDNYRKHKDINFYTAFSATIDMYAVPLFKAGAQWRINSVWHKPSAYGDELKRDVEVIAKTKRGYRFGKFDAVGYSNEYIGFVSTSSLEYVLSDVLEYAYLEDLLPERKEETK